MNNVSRFLKSKHATAAALTGIATLGTASAAMAEETPALDIDFAGIATDMMSSLGPAVLAAVGVGAAIVVATVGWRFFKRFAK